MWSPGAGKKKYKNKKIKKIKKPHLTALTFHRYVGPALRGRFLQFLACGVMWLT